MSHWLLGTIGSPLIPSSWVGDERWSAEVFWGLDSESPQRIERLDARTLASGPFFVASKRRGVLNMDLTAKSIGQSRARRPDGWLDQAISLPESLKSGESLERLPLRFTTWESLKEIGVTPATPTHRLRDVSRLYIAHLKSGWLALLDLETALGAWYPGETAKGCEDPWLTESSDDFVQSFLREVLRLDGQRLDPMWVEWTCKRNGWGTGVPMSLAEVGRLAGLTRERVRQVVDRLQRRSAGLRWPMPPQVRDQILRDAAASESWLIGSLIELSRWAGQADLEAALARLEAARGPSRLAAPEMEILARRAQAFRNALGFVDLELAACQLECPSAALEEALRLRNPRVDVADGWALVRTPVGSTTAETVARKQLGVAPVISIEEIFEGLERYRRQRGSAPNPPPRTAVRLLEMAGAVKVDGGRRVVGKGPLPLSDSIDGWLVEQLRATSGSVLHKDELFRLARAAGMSLNSVGVYLTYSPIVRGMPGGLCRLVGSCPSASEADHARLVAMAKRASASGR